MYDIMTIGAATQDVFLSSRAWEIQKDATSPTGLEQCLPLGAKVPVERLAFAVGGGAANAAATCAALGLRTAALCRIGADDISGANVLATFASRGIAAKFVQQDRKQHTAYSVVLLSGAGHRTILTHRGAAAAINAKDVSWKRLRARWFYVSSLGGNLALARRIFSHAAAHGIAVAWNPGSAELAAGMKALAPLIAKTAMFNVNREEAKVLTGVQTNEPAATLQKLRDAVGGGSIGDARYVLMTDGEQGAFMSVGGATWFAPARSVRAVNATGAGDAFGSAFVSGLAHGWDAPSSLRLAMANAEGVIRNMGAQTGILSKLPAPQSLARFRVRKV
ncbi:MAG: carbohydrate kinase family protein [bacterium]|nr:carbohydrate kinase family protein [bacterium]